MSTLFFEGFNISNVNRDIYLDPKYWTKSLDPAPFTQSNSGIQSTFLSSQSVEPPTLSSLNTYGYISISGAKNFTNPPQFQTHIQLSGISGINTSSGIYISFRVLGLNHNVVTTTSFPHAQKIISFDNGDTEYLTIEAIQVTGASAYAPNWNSQYSNNTGLALRVVQNSNNKVLYDLRIPGISDYDIVNPANSLAFFSESPNLYSFGISRSTAQTQSRFVHFEFYIKNTGLELRVEGVETKDTYSGSVGLMPIDSGNIDNIKFYNRNINTNMFEFFLLGNQPTSNIYWGESAGNICYDDICIVSEDDTAPNYWVGETCRIVPLIFNASLNETDYGRFGLPVSLRNEGWNVVSPDLNSHLMSRDGDNSFISSSESGNIYSVRPRRPDLTIPYMQKDIGGIRMFNEARKVFLNTSFINVYGTGVGTSSSDFFEIGDKYDLSSTNYDIYSSFAMKNPATNNVWTSGDIFGTYINVYSFVSSGIFGVKKL